MNNWYQDANEVLLPTYNRIPIHFERGEGVYLYDGENRRYLDALAGIAVNILGYRHPRLVDEMRTQALEIPHVSNLFHIEKQYKLARELSERGFESAAFFCNSGAEANEAAIKFSRRYSERFGNGGRKIVSFENSFHGRTLGALAATGQEKYRRGFEPLPGGFEYLPYNDAAALEEKLNSDSEVCALMMEPVQGEGGVIPADQDFLNSVRELCDRYNVLLIFDEVQAGIARSGRFFCYQNYDIEPDLVTLAKGLGGGYPIGALLARRELREGLQAGEHASTFGGNPFVCSMSLAVLETIERENILPNVSERSDQLKKGLDSLARKYSGLYPPRGLGLMIGLPMEETIPAAKLMDTCRREGLIVGTAGGNCMRFVPPLIISESETEELLSRFEKALQEYQKS